MDDEREWRHALERFADGDDAEIAAEAKDELERAILRKPAWRHDVRSAFVERPDGNLIDRDDLVGPSDA